MFKSLFIKNKNKHTIKPFESLMMVLAGRIGVGSIAGIAISIYYGGVGSIFWMWMSSILGASLTFIETYLGMIYQKKCFMNWRNGEIARYKIYQKKLCVYYVKINLV